MTKAATPGSDAGPSRPEPFAWTSVVDMLRELERRIVVEDPRVDTPLARAEGLRYLTRLMVMAQLSEIEVHDPAYPRIANWYGAAHQWGATTPNACTTTHACTVTTSIGSPEQPAARAS